MLTSQQHVFVSPQSIGTCYSLRYYSTTVTDMSGISRNSNSPKQTTIVSIDSKLHFVRQGHSQVGVLFDSVRLSYSVNDVAQSALALRVMQEMQRPFLATYDSVGRIHSVQSSPSCSPECISIASSLLALFQYVHANATLDSCVGLVENDRSGRARVLYCLARQHVDSSYTLDKFRRSYLPAPTSTQGRRDISSPQQRLYIKGFSRSEFNSAGILKSFKGCDTQSVHLGSSRIAQTINSYDCASADLPRVLTPNTLQLAGVDSLVTTVLPEIFDIEDIKRAGLESLLASSTLPGILDTLDHYRSSDSDIVKVLPNKLRASATLCEGAIDSLHRRATTYSTNDPRLLLIIDVLAQQGSTKSQDFIVDLLARHSSRAPFVASMLSSFATIQHPSVQSMRVLKSFALQDQSSMVRATALMVWGTLTGRLWTYDSMSAIQSLQNMLLHRDSLSQDAIIYALGNSGLRAAFSPLYDSYKSGSEREQLMVLYSMRNIDEQRVDSLIATNLESRDSVRQSAALATLAYRLPSNRVIKAVDTILDSAFSAKLREQLFLIITRWIGYDEIWKAFIRERIQSNKLTTEEVELLSDAKD